MPVNEEIDRIRAEMQGLSLRDRIKHANAAKRKDKIESIDSIIIRGIPAITKAICEDMPVDPATFKKLVKNEGFPAWKDPALGWCILVEDFKAFFAKRKNTYLC